MRIYSKRFINFALFVLKNRAKAKALNSWVFVVMREQAQRNLFLGRAW